MREQKSDFEPTPPAAGHFPTTSWGRVAAAGDHASAEARAALGELCAAYWAPIYAFIRRKGHGPEEALDLTQDYFARLLEKGTVSAAEPTRGRFRSFLLADCSFFLANRRKMDGALKRGGDQTILAIDLRDAEGSLLNEPAHGRTPERLFERDWALALLGAVGDRLEKDYAAVGRADAFRLLKPILSAEAVPYTAIAAELGTTEGNVRVAVHRLRTRFAAELRRQVAATLDNPSTDEIATELRSLLDVLGR